MTIFDMLLAKPAVKKSDPFAFFSANVQKKPSFESVLHSIIKKESASFFANSNAATSSLHTFNEAKISHNHNLPFYTQKVNNQSFIEIQKWKKSEYLLQNNLVTQKSVVQKGKEQKSPQPRSNELYQAPILRETFVHSKPLVSQKRSLQKSVEPSSFKKGFVVHSSRKNTKGKDESSVDKSDSLAVIFPKKSTPRVFGKVARKEAVTEVMQSSIFQKSGEIGILPQAHEVVAKELKNSLEQTVLQKKVVKSSTNEARVYKKGELPISKYGKENLDLNFQVLDKSEKPILKVLSPLLLKEPKTRDEATSQTFNQIVMQRNDQTVKQLLKQKDSTPLPQEQQDTRTAKQPVTQKSLVVANSELQTKFDHDLRKKGSQQNWDFGAAKLASSEGINIKVHQKESQNHTSMPAEVLRNELSFFNAESRSNFKGMQIRLSSKRGVKESSFAKDNEGKKGVVREKIEAMDRAFIESKTPQVRVLQKEANLQKPTTWAQQLEPRGDISLDIVTHAHEQEGVESEIVGMSHFEEHNSEPQNFQKEIRFLKIDQARIQVRMQNDQLHLHFLSQAPLATDGVEEYVEHVMQEHGFENYRIRFKDRKKELLIESQKRTTSHEVRSMIDVKV